MSREAHPSEVSDGEWALVAPHLALLPEAAGQRRHGYRHVDEGHGAFDRAWHGGDVHAATWAHVSSRQIRMALARARRC